MRLQRSRHNPVSGMGETKEGADIRSCTPERSRDINWLTLRKREHDFLRDSGKTPIVPARRSRNHEPGDRDLRDCQPPPKSLQYLAQPRVSTTLFLCEMRRDRHVQPAALRSEERRVGK